jgi:hypothetical protein
MNFIKYAAGMFVFAGIISLIAGSGGNYFTQSVNAQSLGEQIGEGIGGVIDETGEAAGNLTETLSGAANETGEEMNIAVDETGEAAGNATETLSGAANETGEEMNIAVDETGEAVDNATESASQSVNETASGVGQAADTATASGNSTNATQSDNPLDMLMNLFKGGN